MKWVVDTNIVSAYMQGHPKVIAHWHDAHGDDLLIPAVVLAEGLTGAIKPGAGRWRSAWLQVAGAYQVLPFDALCAACYAEIRAALEARGCMIGLHDCEIAATALAWQRATPHEPLTLVTDNQDEFKRVPGLQVENWIPRP